ncbi:hypothetical protein TYRP_003072 [Tyrophagus putrescentiae]|nr:hypothetical protein TYRP_003072 [Tyrophagus putrescentiae]
MSSSLSLTRMCIHTGDRNGKGRGDILLSDGGGQSGWAKFNNKQFQLMIRVRTIGKGGIG